MAWRSYKRDITKINIKIDKMAKKGRDNFQEYYNYVDSMCLGSLPFKSTLNTKYSAFGSIGSPLLLLRYIVGVFL